MHTRAQASAHHPHPQSPPDTFTSSDANCPLETHSAALNRNTPVTQLKLHSIRINFIPQPFLPQNGTTSTPNLTSLPGTQANRHLPQTALFNFQSLLLVLLLTICTATYAHYVFPGIIDRNKENYFVSPIWKAARVGERLSPYVSLACVVMAVSCGFTLLKKRMG